jgi:hypothetical protein
MAGGSTYQAISTTTLTSAVSSYSFSSIPSTYTDLVLVANIGGSSADVVSYIQFNADAGTNYSNTKIYGNGTAAGSQRDSNITYAKITDNLTATTLTMNVIVQILNYSNSTTYKTALVRFNNPTGIVEKILNPWRSTSAINRIDFGSGANFLTGSTFTLYGIKAA